ncbi:MAG: tetratricopeptide repeat protein, partial [Candidatus Omnitrophica bacterium]|nr:tetratricopeptide repeat protein [Candidatus Omnitrophota bacterium]
YLFFWIFAIFTSFTFIINLKRVKIKHILLFAFSFFSSYMAIRNGPIFIFLGMFTASVNLDERGLLARIDEKKYYPAIILIMIIAIYFFISDKYYDATGQFLFKRTSSGFSRLLIPSGACDFLQENNIDGRIFNTSDFGPYIAYRFYPDKRIFIDTRTDLYKDDFYNLYMRAQNYPNEWRALHKEYGFNIVLLRHFFSGTERILRFLHEDSNWKLVYYDINSCVFLEVIPKNEEFINRFGIDFRAKTLVDSDIGLNTAIFFEKIGEGDFAEKAYVKLLKNNPRLLQTGNNLATIYTNTGRHEEAIRLLEELLQVHPWSAELHANLGTAYLSLRRRQDARLYLEKSLRLNPYLRNACYTLGIIYLEAGEVDRAIGQFVKYLRLNPYNAGVHRILGDIYTQKGLSQKAVSEYNEANALDGKEMGWKGSL